MGPRALIRANQHRPPQVASWWRLRTQDYHMILSLVFALNVMHICASGVSIQRPNDMAFSNNLKHRYYESSL